MAKTLNANEARTTARIVENFRKYVGDAMEHCLGEPPTAKQISNIFANIVENLGSLGVPDPEVFLDPSDPTVITVKFLCPKPPMICINLFLEPNAWLEIREGCTIMLEDIPQDWTLGKALYEHMTRVVTIPWPTGYDFVMLECQNCGNVHYYHDMADIPVAMDDCGSVGCPSCNTPWLYYRYVEGA
jgi:ribosomal protein S27E